MVTGAVWTLQCNLQLPEVLTVTLVAAGGTVNPAATAAGGHDFRRSATGRMCRRQVSPDGSVTWKNLLPWIAMSNVFEVCCRLPCSLMR